MKYKILMLLFLPAMMLNAKTKEKTVAQTGKKAVVLQTKTGSDSMCMDLNEVVVAKSIRENAFLNQLPVSSSSLSGEKLETLNAQNLQSISVYVPNLFVPDYGSKITSAVYMRGIGTRMDISAVGFYVDNIPYLDKSAFNFELQDIDRIDVLRGPQGTLYGRNSMGGLIHIYTNSPFKAPEFMVRLSYGSYNDLNVQISHAKILNPNIAFSVSANYHKNDGYVKNAYNQDACGSGQSAGVRTKLANRFANGWKVDLSVNYEYSTQNGYPYAPLTQTNPVVSYNDPCSYKRNLLSTGLQLEKTLGSVVFNSMTGYQFLNDDLKLDADFSSASLFSLNQKQKQHNLTQEFILKSRDKKPYEWVVGAFGFYRNMNTDAPFQFESDGINMLNDEINGGIPSSANMTVNITDKGFSVPGLFKEKNYSSALYHQSTYHFQKLRGLSAIAGIRLDYENVGLDYATSAAMNFDYSISHNGMNIGDALTSNVAFNGKTNTGYWQVVPKFSLQYDLSNHSQVYASVSKGFQSGGYNIEIFSDLIQTELQNVMSQQMKQSMAKKLQAYVAMGMPQSVVDGILANIPDAENIKNVKEAIAYKPEYSWNYELGTRLEPIEGKLQIDAALFYINCYNRQITVFSPNGFGRMMTNASGSYSEGFEISALAKPLENLRLNASYGYTKAKFTNYKDSVTAADGTYKQVNYAGKNVPMIPKSTLSLGADYTLNMNSTFLDKIILAAQYTAAGPIYWSEANDTKQAFYGLNDDQISFVKKTIRLDFWIKNAFNQKYNTFYFESMGSPFAQQGKPRQLGLTVQWRF
jgi:outer membrane receptor protein involved in Fe transport